VTTQAAPLSASVNDRAPRKSARAGRVFAIAGAVVLAIGAYTSWQLWDETRPYEWSGTVEARTIDVGSRVGGRVKEVISKEGDRVGAGQPLVELEAGDLPAQRLIAKGELDQAAANLEKATRGARPEEIEEAKARAQTAVAAFEETKVGARSEQIAAATARLVVAQVAVDKAQLDSDRSRRLLGTQAISQAQFDDADVAYKSAIAQRDAAAQAVDELKNGSRREDIAQAQARAVEARASARLVQAGSRVEDIAAAQAVVESAQGRLDQIDVMVAELVVRAPRPSRVESLDLRPGDILAPNATAASLVEDDQLYVRIYIPETQIGHIHYGQDVPISVDSFRGRTFKGTIEYINKVGEYSPRNLQTSDERANQVFATRIGIREGNGELRAGMAAIIHVQK
jgi:HlyD family secretion protein